jgi:hypothetical protein
LQDENLTIRTKSNRLVSLQMNQAIKDGDYNYNDDSDSDSDLSDTSDDVMIKSDFMRNF